MTTPVFFWLDIESVEKFLDNWAFTPNLGGEAG